MIRISLCGTSLLRRLMSRRMFGACSQYFPSIGRRSFVETWSLPSSFVSASPNSVSTNNVEARFTSMNNTWYSVANAFIMVITWLRRPSPKGKRVLITYSWKCPQRLLNINNKIYLHCQGYCTQRRLRPIVLTNTPTKNWSTWLVGVVVLLVRGSPKTDSYFDLIGSQRESLS